MSFKVGDAVWSREFCRVVKVVRHRGSLVYAQVSGSIDDDEGRRFMFREDELLPISKLPVPDLSLSISERDMQQRLRDPARQRLERLYRGEPLEEPAGRRRADIKALLADEVRRRALIASTVLAIRVREGIETTHEQAERVYRAARETEASETQNFFVENYKARITQDFIELDPWDFIELEDGE